MTETSIACKRFVSESEIEEIKKKRQEEWDKVRKPEDPIEAPEEEYDPRSLYDRLQEQKDLRETELEESRRLKNLIKGLDDDEVAFLELVDQTKIDMEVKLWEEENKEIQEFRQAVSHLTAEEQEAKLQRLRCALKLRGAASPKKSQQTLLAGALKRKASTPLSAEKNPHLSNGKESEQDGPPLKVAAPPSLRESSITCLGVLPGLGVYSDSSDSDNSSDTDCDVDCNLSLIARRVQVVEVENAQSSKRSQH